MKYFIAGVHAVGKTFLCKGYALEHQCIHKSASDLIKEYKAQSWHDEKFTSDIDNNQEILIKALGKFNDIDSPMLLLDGHFVLLDEKGDFKSIDSSVFVRMKIDGIVLIENEISVIEKRINERGVSHIKYDIGDFILSERQHAESISNELGIKIIKLHNPSYDDFSSAIEMLGAK